jgi:hypothetical protein
MRFGSCHIGFGSRCMVFGPMSHEVGYGLHGVSIRRVGTLDRVCTEFGHVWNRFAEDRIRDCLSLETGSASHLPAFPATEANGYIVLRFLEAESRFQHPGGNPRHVCGAPRDDEVV